MWRIRSLEKKDNRGRSKYWSEEYGWTWKEQADLYTEQDKQSKLPPRGGTWEEEN